MDPDDKLSQLAANAYRKWKKSLRKPKKRKRKPRRRSSGNAKARHREYLRSEWWRARRKQKIDAVGRVCELCGSTRRIQVHHKTYARLGREKDKDLQVLCGNCHKAVHGL